MAEWQPDQYLKYKNERTQPSIDLASRISLDDPRRILDIGCGPGNSTRILKDRWPGAEVYGLDSSESMIHKAEKDHPDIRWLHGNAGDDLTPLGTFDIVFSNAALQWMPDHETLIPGLYALLREGGALAVQVPFVRHLPVYGSMQALLEADKWAGHFAGPPAHPAHHPYNYYYSIISGLSENIQLWQTEYIHIMSDHGGIVEWYKGTGLRPYLDTLPSEALREEFCADYRRLIERAYPVERDGKVLFPFTRIFFLVYK